MALRLKYAGVDAEPACGPRPGGSLDAAVAAAASGPPLYALPTYTALLELRDLLARRGLAPGDGRRRCDPSRCSGTARWCSTARRGPPARLPGYRRSGAWRPTTSRAIPGYKMYLRRSDGARPAVFVAFLDLQPAGGR